MSKFTAHLWSDLVQEHGPALAHAARPEPARARRPRVLAGSTLALAGVGTAIGLGLTAGSTPAFAVTRTGDGTVLVQLNQLKALPDANRKLAAMGINEQVKIDLARGTAAASGAVTCTPAPGVSGPPVQVLVGKNGTEVIASGNTGAGSWYLSACQLTGDTGPGSTGPGSTGPGSTGPGSTGPGTGSGSTGNSGAG